MFEQHRSEESPQKATMAPSLFHDDGQCGDVTPNINVQEGDDYPVAQSDVFETNGVYEIYTKSQKRLILLACAGIGILMPFTDTIYLPALDDVAIDLSASQSSVAATVSVYMAAVAIGQLVFGPLADYFGRLPVAYSGLFVFEAFTLGCIFAPDIDSLIVLRTLEGLFVSSASVSTQAIVADVFAPAERGAAMGAYLAPVLFGPVVAPLVGGGLAQAFGWRSTFMLLAALAAPLILLALASLRHETHHWFARRRLRAAAKSAAAAAAADRPAGRLEAGERSPAAAGHDDDGPRPALMRPWQSLALAVDPALAPYYAVVCTSFAAMFTSLTVLPLALARPPYSLPAAAVGVTYLPFGVATLLGAAAGGVASDRSLRSHGGPGGRRADGRMTALLWPMWACVPSAAGFGFALQVPRPHARPERTRTCPGRPGPPGPTRTCEKPYRAPTEATGPRSRAGSLCRVAVRGGRKTRNRTTREK